MSIINHTGCRLRSRRRRCLFHGPPPPPPARSSVLSSSSRANMQKYVLGKWREGSCKIKMIQAISVEMTPLTVATLSVFRSKTGSILYRKSLNRVTFYYSDTFSVSQHHHCNQYGLYRDRLKGLYMVARNFFLLLALLLNWVLLSKTNKPLFSPCRKGILGVSQ